MSINIKIEKKHLYLLSAILIFLVGVGVVIAASTWTNKPVSHSSDDIKVKIGSDYHSLQYAIDSGLIGGGGASFGAWVDKSSSVNTVNGPATSDGIVVANGFQYGTRPYTRGFSDTNNPPTTLRAEGRGGDYEYVSITFPVKRGDYWKVEQASSIWWIPLQ